MSQIITISREFGSGGRELGKRLAELLGCDYYDREIITAIARQSGLDEGYVERTLEAKIRRCMERAAERISGASTRAAPGSASCWWAGPGAVAAPTTSP